ncbi:MAG: ComF family protein [Chlorobi bacterium]|nr:MAG: ComF family protein [Bacteroidota bacterium]KXK35928.1 MAG: amidophosphoribosyltransferase [Chlorobi bacterium OLB6]MBE2266011.1 ComF family protein [Flavobacteriales bacterium]MBL1161453.1 ComF family protein [Chlorobiota bacterium]MBZ0194996.1 hypothetical protein [Candidatus Kapabacteria bacterium]MCC6331875.1 ComF family protein [Ignavibacteria bacterium]
MKYCFNRSALLTLAELMVNQINSRLKELDKDKSCFDAVIPVPPSKLDRPFQPALELARQIAVGIHVPYDDTILRKTLKTDVIKGLPNYEIRVKMLENVFSVTDRRYEGKSVLVVDDVVETGATLDSVAKVLKEKGGISHVYVICGAKVGAYS